MEAKFCTVTRYDGNLYKGMLKYEGWKLNIFRCYYITSCILGIIVLSLLQTFLMSGRNGGVSAHARIFFIFSACMLVLAFIVEWKSLDKRKERALSMKVVQQMRHSGRPANEKEEIYWYDDCCVIETEEVIRKYKYSGLQRTGEDENYIFLTFGGKVTIPADKDGFRKGKPDKFKKFIEEKMA